MLALLFLMAGSMKFVVPIETMAMPVALPGWFIRFIGAAEVLGAIGLIVPGMTRIRPGLTPLAAGGLLVIMIGATGVTLLGGGGAQALGPVMFGGLLVAVMRGRTGRMRVTARATTRKAAYIPARRAEAVTP